MSGKLSIRQLGAEVSVFWSECVPHSARAKKMDPAQLRGTWGRDETRFV
jgi:hypothetical protein